MTVGFISLIVLLALIAGASAYGVVIYNGLVRLKNNIDRNWSNIDVLLKQRFDELPKLVKVCEGYMQHERGTLEAVTKARALAATGGGSGDNLNAQNAISQALKSLFAVVERYPDLKADVSFRQLQSRISELEDQIADRREFFNESVNLYNIGIEQIPDVVIARAINYQSRELWKIDAANRADVNVAFKQ